MAKAWYYDWETIRNCTVAVYINYRDLAERRVFVIHRLRNDFSDLVDFLENSADNREYHIGFNNLSFDSQIEQALLDNRKVLETIDPEEIAGKIYRKAQKMIDTQSYGEFYNGVPEWRLAIPQLDLFKLNHWDNVSKHASLKWLQFTLDWHRVLTMPIHHKSMIETMEQIDMVIDYCDNDTEFLDRIYKHSKELLQIRKDIKARYKINCMSYSNTKMGSEILLKAYCKKTGKKKIEVKALSTHRGDIPVKDIIFPYVKFRSPEFNRILTKFNRLIIDAGKTKGAFKDRALLKGVEYTYGQGGIHAVYDSGIYHSDDKYIIIDCDVASLHPSIAIANGMYPAHLGPVFTQTYKEDIVDVRLGEKAKGKLGNQGIVKGFKEAANSVYGQSNAKRSWLRDPLYTMQTTINSQLILSMLSEAITLDLEDAQILQVNTDGITVRMLRTDLVKYYEICEEWQRTTMVKLEFEECDSIWMWDVNSYILKYSSGKTKVKGRIGFKDLEPHRNKSFLVVNKAIYEFFVNGVFPEEYLKTNREIYDWCGGARADKDWDFMGTCVNDGIVEYTPLQEVLRYYISNKGCKIVKVHKTDGRKINLLAGPWLQTEFNNYVNIPWESYDINQQFYLEMIRKEIKTLYEEPTKQMKLF